MSKQSTNWGELVIALIVGLLIILSVPMLKDFFTNLIGTILSIILLTIVIGAVIFLGYWLWQKHEEGDF